MALESLSHFLKETLSYCQLVLNCNLPLELQELSITVKGSQPNKTSGMINSKPTTPKIVSPLQAEVSYEDCITLVTF